jgi:MATE family multidrug resistance protein
MDAMLPAARPASRSLLHEVVWLAWPAIVQGLLHTVVFMTDRVMLGRYSADALASMQVSGSLLWSIIAVFTAFSAGAVATVGRAVGAGDAERSRQTVLGVMLLAAVSGVGVAVLGWSSRALLIDLLAGGPETSDQLRAHCQVYLGVMFPVMPIALLGILGTTVLQASGDTRTPMLTAVAAGLLNVLGNWIFIYGNLGAPELGVAGAAIGTASAELLNGCVMVAVLLLRAHPARLVFERFGAGHRRALRSVLRVSRAAFGERIVYHAGFLAFAALVGRLGDAAMAANQALISIESLGFIAADGFGIAAGALVAQKLGARDAQQAERAGWLATGLGVAVLSGIGLVFLAFRHGLMGLFTSEAEIVALGAQCLLVAAFAQPLMAITHSLAAGLRGAGDTRNPLVVALVGPVLVRLAGTWFFAFHLGWGLLGVWAGSTLDWLVRSIWLAGLFRRGRWKSIEV